LYEEDYLNGEIEHTEIVTNGIHGVIEESSKEIEDFLEEEILDEDNSLGVITKSFIEEATLCKEEP